MQPSTRPLLQPLRRFASRGPSGCGSETGASRVCVRVEEHVESAVAWGLQIERLASAKVTHRDREVVVALIPQKSDFDPVVHAAVELPQASLGQRHGHDDSLSDGYITTGT